jgi:hypothetical protein
MEKKVEFVLCAERGELERQVKLLISSIRKFGGLLKDSEIKCYSPRIGNNISRKTLEFMEDNNVEHINIKINNKYQNYGFANKVLSSAHAELNSKADFLIFLDSDMIVLNEPRHLILEDDYWIGLRPVETKLIGATGEDDPKFQYWQDVYNHFNLTLPSYRVKTSVTDEEILPYWNGGLIVIRRGLDLFKKWKDIFEEMMDQKMYPDGRMTFTDQISLAILVSMFLKNKMQILSYTYNYPIQRYESMVTSNKISKLRDLHIMHYHRIFFTTSNLNPLNCFFDNDDQSLWVKKSLVEHKIFPRTTIFRFKHYLRQNLRLLKSNVKKNVFRHF